MEGLKRINIRKSSINRNGVFACDDFSAGEVIFVPKEHKIFSSKRYTKTNSRKYPHALAIAPHTWLLTSRSDPLWHLNHSCKPNACVHGVATIVALRSIKNGEEITIDYSLTDEDPYWYMKCSCGVKGCRGTIFNLPYMAEVFKKAHRDHVADWLKHYTL